MRLRSGCLWLSWEAALHPPFGFSQRSENLFLSVSDGETCSPVTDAK